MFNFSVQSLCLFFTAASLFCGKHFKAVSVHLSMSKGCSDLSQGVSHVQAPSGFPLSQYVTLHLMSTSQTTRKLLRIPSPTESIADKPSPFLILRPTPSGRRLQLQSVAAFLARDKM